jgi:hypothetical protein
LVLNELELIGQLRVHNSSEASPHSGGHKQMAGFIILEDGRAYAAANSAYDAVVRRIADALQESDDGHALSTWLKEQQVAVKGLGSVDLRELTPKNRQLFEAAARKAFSLAEQQGPQGWQDFDARSGWLERFHDLITMMNSVRKGEPPSSFNPHMRDVIPPTGEQAGPGWDSPP